MSRASQSAKRKRYATVLYQTAGGAARITLNRPRKLNALNNQLRADLCAALKRAEADDEVRAVVLRGAGRAFCSGADITDDPAENGWVMAEDGLAMSKRYRRYYTAQWMDAIWDLEKPVVAQVHGHCVGAALIMASACDFAVAADDTVFSLPEARFGAIALGLLPWTVGLRKTKELVLLGRPLSAAEAEEAGLINQAVPVGELEGAVGDMVATLVDLPPEAAYFGKRTVNRAFEAAGLREAMEAAYDANVLSALTEGGFQEWARIRRDRGAQAAVKWRDRTASAEPPARRPRR